jgi:transcriptional regulator with XRE-family HTH domain
MYFSTNIKLLRRRRGRTQDEVAYALNMKRPTLSGYENQVAQPSVDVLIAFADYYGVSIDTLIRVDLSTLTENMVSQIERGIDVYSRGGKLRILATTVNNQNRENIELVHEKAKAGYTRGFADPEFVAALPVFNLPFLPENRKFRTFQINGDSMLPIPSGAWVTGEYLVDWTTIRSGQASIIITENEGLVFKIIENKLDESGKFILHSLNPDFAPYEMHVSDIREIWKFVHFISHQMPAPLSVQDELLQRVKLIQNNIDGIKSQITGK